MDESYSAQDFRKSLILTDLSISKLDSKLSLQRGSSSLNLSDSFIGDEGCHLVAQYLKDNLCVHTLELRGNSITVEGLRSLAPVLRQSFLRSISLEWNNIGDGIGVLTDSLCYNSSIQCLDLRNNRIGPEGASQIARLIENSTTLAKIDLRWNEIGVLGAKKILGAIPRSRSLKCMELSGNKIPEEVILQIEQQMKGDEKGPRTEERSSRNEERLSRTEDKKAREEKSCREERSGLKSPGRSFKEFSYNDELYAKYEAQMIANAKNEARINELEILLEQETRRVQEVRNELLKDLENEKARRSYSDENLMVVKEEALKREMEDDRNIQELESRLNKSNNEKSMAYMDLESLQGQYDKLLGNSQERIRNLEDRINQQERQYRQLEESTRLALDRTKKESEQNLYEVSRDYQGKLEKSEDSIKNLKSVKESLEMETRALKNQITQIKAQAQEALSELDYRIKEEETAKYNSAVRNYEARVKTLEESREGLNKKLQDLQREMTLTEKKNSDQVSLLESNISELREEKAELTGKLQKISAQKDNLSNDLYVMKSAVDRANAENDELNKTLKERKDTHISQLESLGQEHAMERKSLELNRDLLNEQIKILESELNKSRRERDRIIKEHEYLAETLKQRVSSLIQDTVLSHMRKIDSE